MDRRFRNTLAITATAAILLIAVLAAYSYSILRDRDAPTETAPIIPSQRELDYLNVSILGDSYTVGDGADGRQYAYPARISRMLCWVLNTSGKPGSGYRASGTGAAGSDFTDPVRIKSALDKEPDLILLQGGLYDAGLPGVRNAAVETIRAIQDGKSGRTVVVVIGPVLAPASDPSELLSVRDDLAAAASERGVLFVDPIAEEWLTEQDSFSENGMTINRRGHSEYAERLAASLRGSGALSRDSCAPVS